MAPSAALTLAERTRLVVAANPWSSATQVAGRLNEKSASVSSCLLKLVSGKVLVRRAGKGPRGGMGYALAKIDPGPWRDVALNKSCLVTSGHGSMGFRIRYEDGKPGLVTIVEFGTGKRFQHSRYDLILVGLDQLDPV